MSLKMSMIVFVQLNMIYVWKKKTDSHSIIIIKNRI